MIVCQVLILNNYSKNELGKDDDIIQRSEIKRRQFSENYQSWFSKMCAAWASNHKGWSKMKRRNRRKFKKKWRRELKEEIENVLKDID